MAEYIEREVVSRIASIFFTMSMCIDEDECRAMNRAARIIETQIDAIPSADVVEVVRCRDCVMLQVCRFAQGLGLDGYCSQGERKDG